MATRFEALVTPARGADYRVDTPHRNVGVLLAFVGLGLALITLIVNLAAAGDIADNVDTLRWSFGVTTTAFALTKLGIGVILIGILIRLWHRVDSVKEALPALKAAGSGVTVGDFDGRYGAGTATSSIPGPLPVHRMARTMWFPMLAMGFMAVVTGLILSFASANDTSNVGLWSWTQGLQFFGEGMLLGGIAFLLGSILAGLRSGGGEVQESLGITVKTLRMPASAKAFVGLMIVGMMLAVGQFILYIVGAAPADDPTAWFAWLGPMRELSVGVLLASIVLALYTIGSVLGFQFDRIREIIVEGR